MTPLNASWSVLKNAPVHAGAKRQATMAWQRPKQPGVAVSGGVGGVGGVGVGGVEEEKEEETQQAQPAQPVPVQPVQPVQPNTTYSGKNEPGYIPPALPDSSKVAASMDDTMSAMSAMSASWTFLKGGFKTIDLIARECETMEECLQSMRESFPNMDKEEAIKHITEARNGHTREGLMQRYNSNEKDPQEPEIANIMDSEERVRELNPNAKNLVGGDQTPQPQENPNPLDLSMDKLKEFDGGQ